jgi:hypothetical protein
LLKSDFGEKLAQAQAKTYENFLICGDRAFARGGVPIYFRGDHDKKGWDISVGSIGPDRHGDPNARGLHDAPGCHLDLNLERALGSGSFWLAGDEDSALAAAHARQSTFSHIEVLMPELVTDVRHRVRLDSLFRETVRMFSHTFRNLRDSEDVRSFKKQFDRLCDPYSEDTELSRRRSDLLRSLFGEYRFNHGTMHRVGQDFADFDALQQREMAPPTPLTDDELAAIASLLI